MKIPEEKGLKYKASRVSYIHNYILIVLIVFFLTLVLPSSELLPFEISPWVSQLITLALMLLALALLLEPETEIILRQYLITNTEVTKTEGIIIKKSVSIPYQSVADIRVIKGIAGRVFNFGDIIVKGMKDDIAMKGIREPEVVYRVIENKIALMKRPLKKGAKSEKSD